MNTYSVIIVAALFLVPSVYGQSSQSSDSQPKKEVAPIDINRATAEDFATLPGVGPELARRIVAHREKHGPFRRIEDLLVIRGIGRKKWRGIRPFLRVVGAAREPTRSARSAPGMLAVTARSTRTVS